MGISIGNLCKRATGENLNSVQRVERNDFCDILETLSQHAIVMGTLCEDFMKLVTVGDSIYQMIQIVREINAKRTAIVDKLHQM